MKATRVILLGALLLPAQTLKLSDAERAVIQVVVEKPDATIAPFGTGFFVKDDGTLATALHVYNQAVLATAENRGGRLLVRRASRQSAVVVWSTVKLVASDLEHDLVLLRLNQIDNKLWDSVGGIRPLRVTTEKEVEVNSPLQVVGYFGADMFPVALSAHLVGESLFTIAKDRDVAEFLVSAFAVPGHSGSPVMLDDGSVLGVMISIVPVSVPFNNQPLHSGLNRVTKAEHLQRLLSSLAPAKPAP